MSYAPGCEGSTTLTSVTFQGSVVPWPTDAT
jgi:hypothetical protein